MKEQHQKLRIKKSYIIILTFLISILLIPKTTKIIQKINKSFIKLNNSKNHNRLLFGRILDIQNDTTKKCNKADKNLQNYYSTGNEDLVDLSQENKTSTNPQKPKQPIIDFLEDNGTKRNRIINYLKQLIPIVVFFFIGIISIIGWIFCCGLCCGNCCWCRCCLKSYCKLPCFSIAIIFYFISLIACIYGLAQSNNVFVGFSNTECTFMKFIEEIEIGENKNITDTWKGFDGISDQFEETKKKVNEMKLEETPTNLGNEQDQELTAKNSFIDKINDACDDVNSKDYFKSSDSYRLDIVENFGLRDSTVSSAFSYLLNQECENLSQNSNTLMNNVCESFEKVTKDDDILVLDEAKKQIDKLKKPIDDIKDKIANKITTYGDYIDDYGKIGFLVIYGVMTLFIIITGLLVTLLFIYEKELCTEKSCSHNCFKCFIHFSWNLLALLMIITFFIGVLLMLLGYIGKDAVKTIKYIFSEKNLKDPQPLFIDENASTYLDVCINGDGQLVKVIGITGNSATSNIESLNIFVQNLTTVVNEIKGKDSKSFNDYNNLINSEKSFTNDDIKLCKVGSYCNGDGNTIKLDDLCSELNNELTSYKEKWSRNCPKDSNYYTCSNNAPSINNQNEKTICFQPQDCYENSYSIEDRYQSESATIIAKAEKIDFIVKSIQILDKKTTDNNNDDNYLTKIVGDLKNDYNSYIDKLTTILQVFIDTTKDLTDIPNKSEDGQYFSFLNCKFIGKNVFILLHYLEDSLGKNIYSVGIVLLAGACSLIFAISATIFEIIIINDGTNGNIKSEFSHKYGKSSDNKAINYKKVVDQYLKNDQIIALPSPGDYINKLEMNSKNIVLGFNKMETRSNQIMSSTENNKNNYLGNDDDTLSENK